MNKRKFRFDYCYQYSLAPFWCPCSGLPHLSDESERHGLRLWTSGKPFSILSSKSCSYVLYSELEIMRILNLCFFFFFFLADLFWLWGRAPIVPHLPELNRNQNKALLGSGLCTSPIFISSLNVLPTRVWSAKAPSCAHFREAQKGSENTIMVRSFWVCLLETGQFRDEQDCPETSVVVCLWAVKSLEVSVNYKLHSCRERLRLSWKFVLHDDLVPVENSEAD